MYIFYCIDEYVIQSTQWYAKVVNNDFFDDKRVLPLGNEHKNLYKQFGFSGLLEIDNVYGNDDILAGNDLDENLQMLQRNNLNNNSNDNLNDEIMNSNVKKSSRKDNNSNDNLNDGIMNSNVKKSSRKDKKEIDSDMEQSPDMQQSHDMEQKPDNEPKRSHVTVNTRSRRRLSGLTQKNITLLCEQIEARTKLEEQKRKEKRAEQLKKKKLRQSIKHFDLDEFQFCADTEDEDDNQDEKGKYALLIICILVYFIHR